MRYFLTIAASDSSGGAGIQQDLKMAQRMGFWGLSAVTAVTAQSFDKFLFMEEVSEKAFISQLDVIFNNFHISAIKIGVIPSIRFAEIIVDYLQKVNCPIVYDPVIKSSSGYSFQKDDPIEIVKILAEKVTIITPNIPEYQLIIPHSSLLTTNYYVKGGHQSSQSIIEYLLIGDKKTRFSYKRLKWDYSRGTGCAFSSLLSMFLVDNDIMKACKSARRELVKFYSKMN